MSTRLIQARAKPRFCFPWLALLLGLTTGSFAFLGIQIVTATPGEHLEIVVEGAHPFNISQESVTKVLGGPVATWRPIRILVTDRLLSSDEKTGRSDPGADVILSTAIDSDTTTFSGEQGFLGAGVYQPKGEHGQRLSHARDITQTYLDNVGLGHGPQSVAAAALRSADLLDEGPLLPPLFWWAGTVIGLGLTVVTLTHSLSRRRRHERLYQRLSGAQRKLAGVVLELEGLEVTYASTPEKLRTAGYTSTWTSIRNASLALARSEDAVMEAVYTASTALKPEASKLVEIFESKAAKITAQADALMGAGSVLGELAGGQGVLDRLAAPVSFAGRELLARLDARPPGTVTTRRVQNFRKALNALLAVAAGGHGSASTLTAWTRAEADLQRTAQAINRSLRHRHMLPGGRGHHENLSALRVGMGLSGSEVLLTTLDQANAAAHSRFGPLPGTDEDPLALPDFSWWTLLPGPGSKLWLVLAGIALTILSVTVSSVVVAQRPHAPSEEASGSKPLRSLHFDGDLGGIDQGEIRRYLPNHFTEDVDVTVVVRSAEDYLNWPTGPYVRDTLTSEFYEPQVLVDALWRLKSEFPGLLDPATAELRSDHTIIPVWRVNSEYVTIPAIISGAVNLGGRSHLGTFDWEYGSYFVSDHAENQVISAVKELSLGLESNNYSEPEINGFWLFVLLTLSLGLSSITLLLVIRYGGSVSMRLGLFGRNARTLRRLRDELDALALGLDDSRLNAVAGLGASPTDSKTPGTVAESDQRIYERTLVMAWRISEDLASRPLSGRLDAGYVAEIDHLETIVTALGLRENDVKRRTQQLLDATFGRSKFPKNSGHTG
ncbi:hypothetical protein [Arthrobacter psychrochitiniphilus]|uniref:hypothetical protein n=1 Tax=Arthrobacter psychrochitiniphilus TaxID=291045 RepID=UPI003F7C3E23